MSLFYEKINRDLIKRIRNWNIYFLSANDLAFNSLLMLNSSAKEHSSVKVASFRHAELL
jgi:hypothetical protein